MNILAMDTSTAWAGVALQFEGARHSATWMSVHNHGRELVPALTNLMDSAGCDASKLDCVAVALGPGGFSAGRVGVSCAIGIASPHGLTTVGIPTHYLQACALVAKLGCANLDRHVTEANDANVKPAALVSAIPIGRNQFSIAAFDLPLGSIDATIESSICDTSELERLATDDQTVVVGEGVWDVGGEPAGFGSPRTPEVMLDITIESIVDGLADVWPVHPIYAREPTITQPASRTLG